MVKQLANHLKSEYDTDGYNITCKNDFTFNFNNQDIKIPKESVIVVGYGSSKDQDLIIRCVKKISHPFILKMVDDLSLKLINYEIVKHPDSQDKWGYATVICTDGERSVDGDGEVHSSNLKGGMSGYPFTILRKRAEDRAVLRYLGLYQKGFYSESEDVGDNDNNQSSNSIDYDSAPIRQLKDDNTLDKIQNLCKSNGINKDTLDSIAVDVLDVDPSKFNWTALTIAQRQTVLKHLTELIESKSSNNKQSYSAETIDHLKKEINNYKIDKDLTNEELLSKYNSDTGNKFNSFSEFKDQDWVNLYEVMINDK